MTKQRFTANRYTLDETLSAEKPRHYRAPQEHGAIISYPPLSEASGLLASNLHRAGSFNTPIGSTTVQELRELARKELLNLAQTHTARYVESSVEPLDASRPIVLSGHQPELFHPGVWIKNFAVDQIAKRNDAIAIHMIVDNDAAANVTVRIPTAEGSIETVDIDARTRAIPHEERTIEDLRAFDQVGARIEQAIQPIVSAPIVKKLWPHASAAASRMGNANLGLTLSEARHCVEREWGVGSLEVPLSQICQARAFRIFAAHLLSGMDAIHEIYNQAILDYRRENKLRSNSHPAPMLVRDGEFLEAPFWAWATKQPSRRPLFVRRTANAMTLRAGAQELVIGLDATDEIGSIAESIASWETQEGWKIRPRALITTLFARLFLSDLFVHGIGGGKYDQVTDQLGKDIFGCELPDYLVLSATMKLPYEAIPVERDDVRQIDGMLRELWFHPETHFEFVAPANVRKFTELADRKRMLLPVKPYGASAKQWHDQMEKANADLRELFHEPREALNKERKRLVNQQLRDRVRCSREYAFCLFEVNALRNAILDRVENSVAL